MQRYLTSSEQQLLTFAGRGFVKLLLGPMFGSLRSSLLSLAHPIKKTKSYEKNNLGTLNCSRALHDVLRQQQKTKSGTGELCEAERLLCANAN
jgi:hypothetical protein